MNRQIVPKTSVSRTASLALAGLALLILAGCHYSLLNRSSSLAAWSPDGTRLAVCIVNAEGEEGELWLVEPESGSITKLLSGERSSGLPRLLAPRWAPDGKTLFCARTTAGEEDDRRPASIVGITISSGSATEVGRIHYTGSPAGYFASTEAFIPLADGTLVAQDLGEDGIFRLVRIDPASGTASIFAPLTGNWLVISGSRDGNQVAVAAPGSAGAGVTVAVLNNNGEPRPNPLELWPSFGDDPEHQPALTWSPTADQLAIVVEDIPPAGSKWSLSSPYENTGPAESEDFGTLIVLEAATGRSTVVSNDVFGIPPVYSPDGKHLAYAASSGVRDGDGDLMLEIRIFTESVDGKEVSLPGLALPLAWSADSSMLAYYLGLPDDDNTGSVISVALDGRGTHVVAQNQKDRLAAASPAGGRLAWISGDGAVQVIDPGTGQVIFHKGLTVSGTIQAGEDHLRQDRPEKSLKTWSDLDKTALGSECAARVAAGSFTALRTLDRHGDAARLLEQGCTDLAATEDPPLAFLVLCGALSDYGFRPEAERLVEEQLLAHYPDSEEAVEALWALAALKQNEGDNQAALRHLERLLRSYPEERTEVTRALLLAALAEAGENPPLVIELSEKIIEVNADSSNADQAAHRSVSLYARGLALERQGRHEEAKSAYAGALAQDAGTNLTDGRSVEDLCWEALLRLARSETPSARR